MLKDNHSLPLRTLVGNYLIQEMVYQGKDMLCYRAEDMRLNRQILLKEYYPSDIASREMKQDNTCIVNIDPAQYDIFITKKKQIINTYEMLKGFHHDSIASFHGILESNGTIYIAYDYINIKTVQLNIEQKINYCENDIGVFIKSLVVALTALQYQGLIVQNIQAEKIHIDNEKNAIISGLTDFAPLKSSNLEHLIYDIGLLMYVMVTGSQPEADKKIEELIPDNKYSTFICELINSMLSPDLSNRPKRLQEIQTLNDDYKKDFKLD